MWTATYAGSCADSESTSETLTGTGLTVTLLRSSGFERTFEDCDIELNVTADAGEGVLAGRACGISVRVDFQ